MVDLMRRACFFGREKGFAEERVQLHNGPAITPDSAKESSSDSDSSSKAPSSMQETAVKWAEDMFRTECD
jgi:hypothetical protein